MSGFKISKVSKLGPLDENAATTGDGRIPTLVPSKVKVAVARGGGGAVVFDDFPGCLTNGNGWEEVSISNKLFAVGGGVGEYHTDTAGVLHDLSLLNTRADTTVTDHDLPDDELRV